LIWPSSITELQQKVSLSTNITSEKFTHNITKLSAAQLHHAIVKQQISRHNHHFFITQPPLEIRKAGLADTEFLVQSPNYK